jgi:hypothetical protein
MNSTNLEKFVQWASEKNGQVSISKGGSNQSARLDLESHHSMGRITYWQNGFCDAEIIEIESELQKYQTHWDQLLPDEFDKEFQLFLGLIYNDLQ